MRMTWRNLLLLSGMWPGTAVMAHPGHGAGGEGLWHYLTEPLHLIGLVVVLLVGIGACHLLLRRRRHLR